MCLLQNQPGQGVWPAAGVWQPEGGSPPQVHGEESTSLSTFFKAYLQHPTWTEQCTVLAKVLWILFFYGVFQGEAHKNVQFSQVKKREETWKNRHNTCVYQKYCVHLPQIIFIPWVVLTLRSRKHCSTASNIPSQQPATHSKKMCNVRLQILQKRIQ